jgi:hypothetical protein
MLLVLGVIAVRVANGMSPWPPCAEGPARTVQQQNDDAESQQRALDVAIMMNIAATPTFFDDD